MYRSAGVLAKVESPPNKLLHTVQDPPCHDLLAGLGGDDDRRRDYGPNAHDEHAHAPAKTLADPAANDDTYASY